MHPRLNLYWELARPFTLLAPALGMLCGGLTALGAASPMPLHWGLGIDIAIGTLMAAMLNAGSNGINQIYDLEVDRVNKPGRPIPSGRISIKEAGWATLIFYLVACGLALLVNLECFLLAAMAAILTVAYSVPPVRTKRHTILANLTIAIPRGVLLTVAGWSTVRPVFFDREPWFLGIIIGAFLLGAASTKDYADMKGDAAGGCNTLPIRYGPKKAAWMISPFFVFPFLLIPLGVWLGILTGIPRLLYIFGGLLTIWGAYTIYLILKDPEELARTENHPSWRHMYLMMCSAQIAFATSYLLKYIPD